MTTRTKSQSPAPGQASLAQRLRARPGLVAFLAVTLIGLIAWFDYVTGIWFRIFPFYYLAIAFGAQFISMRAGVLLALLSSVSWMSSNLLSGEHPYGPGIWSLNFLTMTMSFLVVGYLIGRLRHSLDRERDLSRRDNLTGLHNSRAFHELGTFAVAGARRTGSPLTLAFIDLDNFKAVNDRLGHHEGDRVLREAGALLAGHFRESDLVARLGGDEFAALLPDTVAEDATIALERLRAELESLMSGQGLPVTMSIGAVHFAAAPDHLEAAIHAADELMYEVKHGGKNRVLVRSH
jgi:diguanylate cyclase (GGDEF)-like protein